MRHYFESVCVILGGLGSMGVYGALFWIGRGGWALFLVGGVVWVNILGGWESLHCLIMPNLNRLFKLFK